MATAKPKLVADNTAPKQRSRPMRSADNTAEKLPPAEKGKVLYLKVPDTKDPQCIRQSIAEDFPEYDTLNSREQRELVDVIVASQGRRHPIRIHLIETGPSKYSINLGDGENQQLFLSCMMLDYFGTNSMDFLNARANEMIAMLGSLGKLTDAGYNAYVAYLADMKPRDTAEAMMLTQMYATHVTTMNTLRMFNSCEVVTHSQVLGNLAAKFLRASQGQMDSFHRMRRGGEQIIKHVHVDNRNGGQAIITDQLISGGSKSNVSEQPHALSAALLGADPFGNGVPISSREGEEALQDARRSVDGGTQG